MLTKIENDIRSSEGEALTNILNSVDVGDIGVNRLNAYIIPESGIVIRGSAYNARVILSAEDSTRHPRVFVNGKLLDDADKGFVSIPANNAGTFPVEGYLEITGGNGHVIRRNFSGSYTVVEPSATIAPAMMNVLYAGIGNEIDISVPGIAPQDVSATMTNGTLARRGGTAGLHIQRQQDKHRHHRLRTYCWRRASPGGYPGVQGTHSPPDPPSPHISSRAMPKGI